MNIIYNEPKTDITNNYEINESLESRSAIEKDQLIHELNIKNKKAYFDQVESSDNSQNQSESPSETLSTNNQYLFQELKIDSKKNFFTPKKTFAFGFHSKANFKDEKFGPQSAKIKYEPFFSFLEERFVPDAMVFCDLDQQEDQAIFNLDEESNIPSKNFPIDYFQKNNSQLPEFITKKADGILDSLHRKSSISNNIRSRITSIRNEKVRLPARSSSASCLQFNKEFEILKNYNDIYLALSQKNKTQSLKIKTKRWQSKEDIILKSKFNIEESLAHQYVIKLILNEKNCSTLDKTKIQENKGNTKQIIYRQYNHEDGMAHHKHKIKYITLPRLLNEIVSLGAFPENNDNQAFENFALMHKAKYIFLMTYEKVINALDLFKELIKRYFGICPLNLSHKENKVYRGIIEIFQANVLDFIRLWLLEKPHDFCENKELVTLLKAFLALIKLLNTGYTTKKASILSVFIDNLQSIWTKFTNPSNLKRIKLIELIIQENNFSSKNKEELYFDKIINLNKPINFSIPQCVFLALSAEEIAKQICLVDENMYSVLKHKHLPYFTKRINKTSNSAYSRIVNHTNLFSYYIIYIILSERTKQGRTQLITKFYQIIDILFNFRNYQSFFILMNALSHFLILRVKDIFSELNDNSLKQKIKLDKIFSASSGYSALKKEVKNATYPMIPPMVLISKDLAKLEIEENLIEMNGLTYLNFKKIEEIYEIIDKIFQSQQTPYFFPRINIINELFASKFKNFLEIRIGSTNPQKIEEFLFGLSQSKII